MRFKKALTGFYKQMCQNYIWVYFKTVIEWSD